MYISLYIFALFSDHSGCSKNNPRQISLLNFFSRAEIFNLECFVGGFSASWFLGEKNMFLVLLLT